MAHLRSETQPTADRFKHFEPSYNWVHTLILELPGYKKEELKVQISKTRILKVSGKGSDQKRAEFYEEFPIPPDVDIFDGVSAKFEGGKLSVSLSEVAKEKPRRPPTLELPSLRTQDFKNALSALVLIIWVLVIGLFFKSAIKSTFGLQLL